MSRLGDLRHVHIIQNSLRMGHWFSSVRWAGDHMPYGWERPAQFQAPPAALCRMSSPVFLSFLYCVYQITLKKAKNIFKESRLSIKSNSHIYSDKYSECAQMCALKSWFSTKSTVELKKLWGVFHAMNEHNMYNLPNSLGCKQSWGCMWKTNTYK